MPLRLAVFAAGLIAAGALAVQAQPIGKNLTKSVTNTASSAGHTVAKTGEEAGHTAAKTGRAAGHTAAKTGHTVSHGVQKAVGANPK